MAMGVSQHDPDILLNRDCNPHKSRAYLRAFPSYEEIHMLKELGTFRDFRGASGLRGHCGGLFRETVTSLKLCGSGGYLRFPSTAPNPQVKSRLKDNRFGKPHILDKVRQV